MTPAGLTSRSALPCTPRRTDQTLTKVGFMTDTAYSDEAILNLANSSRGEDEDLLLLTSDREILPD